MAATFLFLVCILGVTQKGAPVELAGIAIRLTLIAIHLLGINITGTSVNPARSLGPAIVGYAKNPHALEQVWLFIVAPLIGAAIAGYLFKSRILAAEDVIPEAGRNPMYRRRRRLRASDCRTAQIPFSHFWSTLNWPHGLSREMKMGIIWTILIGFIAGVLAKFVTPGDTHEPQGFILTTVLGIAGAIVATYLGQALGWYQEGQAAGFIGATVGAILILLVWGFIASRRQPPNARQ